MADQKTVLEVEGISKNIGKKTILENITFSVDSGEAFGLIGPNGAGKTTLMKTIIGFYKQNSGNINFPSSKKKYRDVIGFSAQQNAFYDELTVEENLSYFASLYSIPTKEIKYRINELLKIIDLSKEKKRLAGNLSGGMKKRLDIACSVINDPEILVLDEPFAGLDPHQRQELWNLLYKIKESGTAVIISSHLLGDLEHFCDRIALIFSGTSMFVGTPSKLKEKYIDTVHVRIQTYPGNYRYIKSALRGMHIEVLNTRDIEFYTSRSDMSVTFRSVLHLLDERNESIVSMEVKEKSLDELFERFVK